jgi:protein SCO1
MPSAKPIFLLAASILTIITSMKTTMIGRRKALGALGGLGFLAPVLAKEPAESASTERVFPLESDFLPDIPVTDQNGKQFRFYSHLVAGKAVVISFIYTKCQGSCPGTTAKAVELRNALSPLVRNNLTFLTVTLDPANDTPEVLKKYAAASLEGNDGKGLAGWHFLTGKPEHIDMLRRALGYYDPDPAVDADRSQHAAMLTFGEDKLNRWTAQPVGISEGQLLSAAMRVFGRTTAERYHFHQ